MILGYYVHDLSPFLIRFQGEWGIRYYGLAYVLGFLIFFYGMRWQIRRGWCVLKADGVEDFVIWVALIGVVLGGRLGYCLMYDWPRTVADPLSIFQIWKGGMASHGGIIGVISAMVWYGKKHRIPFYNLADAAALCTPLGLALGRLANFINGELWGRPTTVPWGVIFPNAPLVMGEVVPRHPSQLYAALLEGVLLFLILLWLRFKTRKEGVVALAFVGGYGVMRIISELFREPDRQIGYLWGGLTQGQLLSIGLLVLAGILARIQFAKASS